jgi:hypothetical protein
MRQHAMSHTWLALALAVASLTGCGGIDPSEASGGDGGELVGDLLPLQVGNTWTYRVTSGGEVTTKTQTVGEQEQVGGTGPNAGELAFRMTTRRGASGSKETVSWQARVGDDVVRYREQAFHGTTGALKLEEHWDPYKLRVSGASERRQAGATYLEEYSETKVPADGATTTATQTDRWEVVSSSEQVTVPAGTFQALVLRKSGGMSQKTYWFVPGVGKVKETGSQIEELVSYEVSP